MKFQATYDELFTGVQTNDDQLDIEWDDEEEEDAGGGGLERSNSTRRRRQSVSSADFALTAAFGAKHARMLSKLLTHVQLPGNLHLIYSVKFCYKLCLLMFISGLSSVDQMHLLAVADTLSSFSADAIDRLAQANAGELCNFIFCFFSLWKVQLCF